MRSRVGIEFSLAVAFVIALGVGVAFGRGPINRPGRRPAADDIECLRDGATLIGYGAIVPDPLLRQHPVLNLMTALTFDSVKLVDGDVRWVQGGFAEASNPTDFASNRPENWYSAYDLSATGSTSAAPVYGDFGTGLSRLHRRARIEFRAKGGRLLKFRGAPYTSDTTVFDGQWERPGDDSAFTARMNAFLKIAIELKKSCQ